jgi:hypothetical protein
LNLNPAVGDCMFGPNRRNSKRWTHFSQRFRVTLRVNNHR